MEGSFGATHRALPGRVPRVAAALVQRDEQAGAAVAVGEREAGFAHLLAGGRWACQYTDRERGRGGRTPRLSGGVGGHGCGSMGD
jgi:hypothetical protein